MAVSNTDDHFRNHGFLLTNNGWELSPLYDVNPDIYGEYLSLNVNETESRIDFDLALQSARYYGINESDAEAFICEVKNTVKNNWEALAKKYKISRNEIVRMSPAFQICTS